MARQAERLRAAGVGVLIVAQAEPAKLAAYLRRNPQPVPVVSDPTREAHHAFGLGRFSWFHFLRPRVLLGFFWLFIRGYTGRIPVGGEDLMQQGGDFVLDRNRRVVYSHPGLRATDRPTVRSVLADVGRKGLE